MPVTVVPSMRTWGTEPLFQYQYVRTGVEDGIVTVWAMVPLPVYAPSLPLWAVESVMALPTTVQPAVPFSKLQFFRMESGSLTVASIGSLPPLSLEAVTRAVMVSSGIALRDSEVAVVLAVLVVQAPSLT